jgi:hypothetical protein
VVPIRWLASTTSWDSFSEFKYGKGLLKLSLPLMRRKAPNFTEMVSASLMLSEALFRTDSATRSGKVRRLPSSFCGKISLQSAAESP